MSTSRSATPNTRPETKHQHWGCGGWFCSSPWCSLQGGCLSSAPAGDFAAGASPRRLLKAMACRKTAPAWNSASADGPDCSRCRRLQRRRPPADKPAGLCRPKRYSAEAPPVEAKPAAGPARSINVRLAVAMSADRNLALPPAEAPGEPPAGPDAPAPASEETAVNETGRQVRPVCPRSGRVQRHGFPAATTEHRPIQLHTRTIPMPPISTAISSARNRCSMAPEL